MARRGRPRKTGPGEANGQLQRRRFRDGPTPELKSLRDWYAGDGDPNLTTYPLGILLANEAISEDPCRLPVRLATLAGIRAAQRRCRAVRVHGSLDGHRPGLHEGGAQAQGGLRGAAPAPSRRVLDGIVIYERMPRWMRPVIPRLSDVMEAGILVDALGLLVARCSRALLEAA